MYSNSTTLAKDPIEDSDLQRIGQKEKELSERLDKHKNIAKEHSELSAAIANARLKASNVRRSL